MMHYKMTRPRSIISVLCSILFCLVLLSPATAAGQEKIRLDASAPQKVTLTVGKSVIVESPAAIKKFALAAPEYADVTVLSPRQIYLIGKVPGATNATLWGVDGKISGHAGHRDHAGREPPQGKDPRDAPEREGHQGDGKPRCHRSFGYGVQHVEPLPGCGPGQCLRAPGQG